MSATRIFAILHQCRIVVGVLCVLGLAGLARGQTTFTDRTPTLAVEIWDDKAAWGDYNNDGLPDLLTPRGLLQNDGDHFTIVPGPGWGTFGQGKWGTFGDFNNDGFLDVFTPSNGVYLNQAGSGFTAAVVPATPNTVSRGVSLLDYDGDGYLDVYAGGYEVWPSQEYPDIMLHNDGGQSFSLAWTQAPILRARGITSADFDRDGDMDVYVSNYRLQPNNLWRNDGAGTFTDAGAALGVEGDGGLGAWGHTIGSCWGDLDNDGYLDLFVGNFSHPESYQDRPMFLKNLGPGGAYHFQDKSASAGLAWQESFASPALADYDNDGDLDLYFTTVYAGDYPVLYRNDGEWGFTDVTAEAGLAGLGPTYQAAWADFDLDGDLDLVTNAKIFVNEGNNNHWLEVRLHGDGETVNSSAIGAQVRIRIGNQTLTRQVESGTGEGNSNDLTLHFGLGGQTGPVDLEVFWPDGRSRTITGVDVDQLVMGYMPEYGAPDDGSQYVGYNSIKTFTQTTGTNVISNSLHLGFMPNSIGAYTLDSAKIVTHANQFVGVMGGAIFTHNSGTNNVTGQLWMAVDGTSQARYTLNDGALNTSGTVVAGEGGATFVQAGGTHNVAGTLSVAVLAGGSGTYELADGELSTNETIVAGGGTGVFIHSGGQHHVATDLYLGKEAGTNGQYGLSDLSADWPVLFAENEYVGYSGSGIFTHSEGGNLVNNTLFVGYHAGSTGLYLLSDAEGAPAGLSADFEVIGSNGTGGFAQIGGRNVVNVALLIGGQAAGAEGVYTIGGGELDAFILRVGDAGAGTLSITDPSADILVRSTLVFGAQGVFDAEPGSTIRMTGSAFENASTDPADLAGLANLRLVFEGGAGSLDNFEVAGRDLTADLAGLEDNFALDTLQLGGEADVGRVKLVDLFDNQPGWIGSEALYVENLILGAGSSLDLNGLSLYYLSLIDQGGDIILNGGTLMSATLTGDLNGDGFVGQIDLDIVLGAWGTDVPAGDRSAGDASGDGFVGQDDLDHVLTDWGNGTPPPPVPEPATLSLLALGGLALIRRRR